MQHIDVQPAERRESLDVPAAPTRPASNTMVWLLLILATGLILRLALLPYRWINPDEGAHLMDGQLILHGFVPVVDFGSRQPFYAYIQAMMLGLFGGSYMAARLLPVAAIMGSAFLVFLIARRLFNAQVALLATAIYTFHPLVVIWSPVVKTEPLTTLLSALGVYLVVRFTQSEDRWRLLIVAGVALGLAFYVRESSLAVALAVAVFLLVTERHRPKQLARAWGALALGGLVVVGVVMAFFAQYMTAAQLWNSPLNPIFFVLSNAATIGAAPAAGAAGSTDIVQRLALQSWQTTLGTVRETIRLNAYLFGGLAISLGMVVSGRARKSPELRRATRPLVLLYCWAFALMLAYGYWAVHRGYFTQYFNETIPSLAIILAFTLWYLARVLAPAATGTGTVLVSGAALTGIFTVHRLYPGLQVPHLLMVLVPALLLALLYLPLRHLPTRRARWGVVLVAASAIVLSGAAGTLGATHTATLVKLALAIVAVAGIAMLVRTRAGERGAFLGLVVLAALSVVTIAASGRVMGVTYQCLWSPGTVADVARYIRAHSKPGDEVMSGGVIWEVAANRPPFMRISHPLAYDHGAPPAEAARMRAYLHATPPRLIILDSYTTRTYLSYLDPDGTFLASRYELQQVLSGARDPVKIYGLTGSTLSRR